MSTTEVSSWRFSSKRVDPETGLVYFGRRYYDPILGKWLTQDPLGLKAGPNLYAYVLNCPMTMFDLYGLLENTDRELCDRVYTKNGNHVLTNGYIKVEYSYYLAGAAEGPQDYDASTTNQFDHPMYKGFWDGKEYDIFWDESEGVTQERSWWISAAEWSLVAMDGVFYAMDAFSCCTMAAGASSLNPCVVGVGVAGKGTAIAGRAVVRRALTKLVSKAVQKITRVARKKFY